MILGDPSVMTLINYTVGAITHLTSRYYRIGMESASIVKAFIIVVQIIAHILLT
jgi:hypothetical protein